MQAGALAAYEYALATSAPLHLQHRDGRTVPLDVARWLAPADATDLAVVEQTVSPVLDVGCGPGRITAALADRGRFALGIDIAVTAVDLARTRGVTALHRDVFGRLPGEGRWQTVLLLDGNIGIGGDVDALLTRLRQVITPTGRVIVETHPDVELDEAGAVRFVLDGSAIGPEFAWREVGLAALERSARRCNFTIEQTMIITSRTFVTLAGGG